MTLEEALEKNKTVLEDLRTQLRNGGKVIPFVGAGMSFDYKYKGWTAFLSDLGKEERIAEEIEICLKENQYEEAASRLLSQMTSFGLEQAIVDEYKSSKIKDFVPTPASECLRLLTEGPIITTNYDRVIERTYRHLGLEIEAVVGAKVKAVGAAIQSNAKVLLKIHGDVEQIEDRILTKEDYDIHYGEGPSGGFDENLPLPKALMRIMTGKPLLFLGCSLEADRTLRVLKWVMERVGATKHYAILAYPGEDKFAAKIRHLREHHIRPIWFDASNGFTPFKELLLYLAGDRPDPTFFSRKEVSRGSVNGVHDSRLRPNDRIQGSDAAQLIREIEDWLKGALLQNANVNRIFCVYGTSGIGKTLCCLRALSHSIANNLGSPIFIVEAEGVSDSEVLLDRIANEFGISGLSPPELCERLDLEKAVLYLDGIDELLQDVKFPSILERFSQFQKITVLCSSQNPINARYAKLREAKTLDPESAWKLFCQFWENRTGGVPPDKEKVMAFISQSLGNHPLSILVCASCPPSLGNFENIQRLWEEGFVQPSGSLHCASEPFQTLDRSLSKPFQILKSNSPEIVITWGAIALFPNGMHSEIPRQLNLNQSSIQHLLAWRLLEEDGKYRLLPPVRRFILKQLTSSDLAPLFESVIERLITYFTTLSIRASSYQSNDSSTDYFGLLKDELVSIEFLLNYCERKSIRVGFDRMERLYDSLKDLFLVRPILGRSIISRLILTFGRSGNKAFLADANYNHGVILQKSGMHREAAISFGAAGLLFREEKNKTMEAKAIFCKWESEVEVDETAIEKWKVIIDAMNQNHEFASVSMTPRQYYCEAIWYQKSENLPASERRYVEAINQAKLQLEDDVMISSSIRLADLLIKAGNALDAGTLIESLELIVAKGFSLTDQIACLHLKGRLDELVGNKEEAQRQILEAIRRSESEGIRLDAFFPRGDIENLYPVEGRNRNSNTDFGTKEESRPLVNSNDLPESGFKTVEGTTS